MKKMTSEEIIRTFIDYFVKNGHTEVESASLIPHNDPSVLWINAGVTPLKKYFDGTEVPSNRRLVSCQKCIRTGDIESVGRTARHHTFFQMLGNFSIGDYFKKEALTMAFELLTSPEYFGFDIDKLYVTVYPDDIEANNLWASLGIHPSHIIKLENNYWEIGEGPSGPDSEIFYDRGEKYDPKKLGVKLLQEEIENDRYIEIWNNVFSQFNAKEGVPRSEYEELPSKNIDTGMGVERMACIIQETETNYETDLFMPIMNAISEITQIDYCGQMEFKVIADHVRTLTFALSDGATFENYGRGYVLRRLLRRAVRMGKKLGISHTFMADLVDVVIDKYVNIYPDLIQNKGLVKELITKEEELFQKTLISGEKRLEEIFNTSKDKVISGEDAFKLYDTYGFPFELTLEIAQESNLKVDEEGFKEELKLQQMRSRGARVDNESMTSQKPDLMAFDLPSTFEYDPTNIRGVVIGLFKDGVKTDQLDDYGEIVFDVTTFYAEMGGQCADTGIIYNDECKAKVVNVLKAPNQQHLHFVELESGNIKVGDVLTLEIDKEKRSKITANHTATHILQAALKEVIGSHINQAGSYVDDSRLRFDFTHFEKITNEQLKAVEQKVNDVIFKGIDVEIANMSKEEALASGAMALFDEKYGDTVRVVSVGDYSKELCGGCHVTNSSNIGLFKIETEESVGSGIRRIEAVTGKVAYEALVLEKETVDTISSVLKLKNRKEVVNKVTSLTEELNAVKKEVEALNSKLNALNAANRMNDIQDINGVKVLFVEEDMESNKAKQLAFDLRDKIDSGIVILVSKFEEKCSYFVGVSKDYVASGIKAGDVVKKINAIVDGRGGGKPDFAQGGCPVNEKINAIKDELKNFF